MSLQLTRHPLLADNTLFIDNSRAENFTTCQRKGEYVIVYKMVPAVSKPALFFGETLHLVLKYRYLYWPVEVPISPLCTFRQYQIIDEMFKDYIVKPDEFRTKHFAKQVTRAYNSTFPVEGFTIYKVKGEPIVERSFAIKLGMIGDISVVWKGRIDLAIADEKGFWVWDNKTTSVGGDFFLSEFPTSSQMRGYCYALWQLTGQLPKGVVINGLVGRKPTRTGKGIEFQRNRFTYDEESLVEWRENTLRIASDLIHCEKRGFYAQHTKQCIGRYNICEYHSVCTLPPSGRLTELATGGFRIDTFDPLHPDRVDLKKVHEAPLPDNWEKELNDYEAPSSEAPADVMAIINDLVNTPQIKLP